MKITNFDIQSMVDEIPSKYNRDKHRSKDGNLPIYVGVILDYLIYVYSPFKSPYICRGHSPIACYQDNHG